MAKRGTGTREKLAGDPAGGGTDDSLAFLMVPVRTALAERLGGLRRRPAPGPDRSARPGASLVERYWTRHTVRAKRFRTTRGSARYLEWRFEEYPLFRELSGLYGDHDGQVVLDYGCGPGNDLTGFAIHTSARRLIGMDVSPSALGLARRRLALHGVGEERVSLMHVDDNTPRLPLPDDSVDHVNCQGVLHHTADPGVILAELARVTRPGGTAGVMVYNRDSVWFHLYVAYERQLVQSSFPGVTDDEAFARSTDGPDCPISRSYSAADFLSLCHGAGFEADYVGGYLSRHELRCLDRSFAAAIADTRLDQSHREFLRELTMDHGGRPMLRGYHAGIGGTYHLRLP